MEENTPIQETIVEEENEQEKVVEIEQQSNLVVEEEYNPSAVHIEEEKKEEENKENKENKVVGFSSISLISPNQTILPHHIRKIVIIRRMTKR